MVKNPPLRAGNAGSTPGRGRFHLPRAIKPTTTTELTQPRLKPMSLEPRLHNRSHCNEKAVLHNERVAPALLYQRKPASSNQDPAQPKFNK